MARTVHPTMHPFDLATGVECREGSLWGKTSDSYWAFVGPFGGASAATLLRAVLSHPERAGDPVAVTVNFCAPIEPGEFRLDVRNLRTNRSSQHWMVTLLQGTVAAACATVVLARRTETWRHQELTMPTVPDFGDLAEYQGPSRAKWVDQYELRFARGEPRMLKDRPDVALNTHSEVWIADRPARRIDFLSLVAMSDAFFGRIFHALGKIVPFGTVSLTTYVHASTEDLEHEPTDVILGTASANMFNRNYADQTGALWAPSGRLLATTQQLAYFKA